MRWLLIAVVACGGKSEEPAPAVGSDPPPIPNPQDKLSVTVKGKSVAMTRAFVKRLSADNWRVRISDAEGSCDELLSSTTDIKPGATTISFAFSKQLAPDGTESVRAYEVNTAENTSLADVGPIEVAGSSETGKAMTLVLPEITEPNSGITIKGTVTATGCGDNQPPKITPRTSASTITVNHKRLDIKAVALFPDGDLAISTEPMDCKMITPVAPIVLWHDNRQWQLSGSWIAGLRQPVASDADAKGLGVEIGKPNKTRDGKVVAVALRGSAELRDFHDKAGYKIELAGKVEAVDCRDGK